MESSWKISKYDLKLDFNPKSIPKLESNEKNNPKG